MSPPPSLVKYTLRQIVLVLSVVVCALIGLAVARQLVSTRGPQTAAPAASPNSQGSPEAPALAPPEASSWSDRRTGRADLTIKSENLPFPYKVEVVNVPGKTVAEGVLDEHRVLSFQLAPADYYLRFIPTRRHETDTMLRKEYKTVTSSTFTLGSAGGEMLFSAYGLLCSMRYEPLPERDSRP